MAKRITRVRKIPILAEKSGKPHIKMVRRQNNDQVMQEFFSARGYVRLRLQPAIQALNGNYNGWQGSGITIETPTPDKATEFVQAMHNAVIKICQDLGLTAKMNSVIS